MTKGNRFDRSLLPEELHALAAALQHQDLCSSWISKTERKNTKLKGSSSAWMGEPTFTQAACSAQPCSSCAAPAAWIPPELHSVFASVRNDRLTQPKGIAPIITISSIIFLIIRCIAMMYQKKSQNPQTWHRATAVPESSKVMKAAALQSASFRPTQPVETDKGSLPFHPASPGSL